jgi:hypothetical protein
LLRGLDALAALARATPVLALLRALFLLLAPAIHPETGKRWHAEGSADNCHRGAPGAHCPKRSRQVIERKSIHVGVS